ncbi:hypothetical protein C0989_004485 [Termitomyces sp. Mn162]|nr:hypothetical protein C0989_004485 [Termitomyces sp. Mn162]
MDSSASSVFISNQLNLQRNDLNKPLELQLFDGSPATTRIMQYHNNTLTLNNDLQFQNLTMQFPSPEASLAAAIHLRLQSISDLNIPHPDTITSGMTQDSPTPDDNPNGERSTTPSQLPSDKL